MDCFKNGKIIPYEDARVHVSDLGLLRSYAAFDYLRTYNGRPFHLEDHLARFRASAGELNLPLDYNNDELSKIIVKLLRRSDLAEAGVRLIITGGNSPDSMSTSEPNFFILIEPLPEYPRECWEKGVALITCEYLRDIPLVKSTGYLNAIKMMPLVHRCGAHDVLYCHDGCVLELTRNNFFLFKGNTLVTPRDNILLGVTRKVLLKLCDHVFDIEERVVPVSELSEATEAFLCGTTKGVMPVVRVDDIVVGDGGVGPNTTTVMDIFRHHVNDN